MEFLKSFFYDAYQFLDSFFAEFLAGLLLLILARYLYQNRQLKKEKKRKDDIVRSMIQLGDDRVKDCDLDPDTIKEVISSFENILADVSREFEPLQYAKLQISSGNAFSYLSQVEKKEQNLKAAIGHYKNTLAVHRELGSQADFATTQNNLGNAYSTLSEVRDKESNCEKAIKAYEEALKVYTKEHYPQYHQLVLDNLEELKSKI